MMFRWLAALVAAWMLTACSIAMPGPTGEGGEAHLLGPWQGTTTSAAGCDSACCAAGSRLIPEVYKGKDGSRLPSDRMYDPERAEFCKWQPVGDALRCMPPLIDRTELPAWIDPTCDGDFADVRVYAPASYPEGTSRVRILSGNPALHHKELMRGEEVQTVYSRGPDGLGPCEPVVPSPGSAFQPPFFHWVDFDPSAFVGGAKAPLATP